MSKVIGVQFQQNGKMIYCEANGIEATVGQYVVANTDRGQDLGMVVMNARELDERVQIENLKKVVRLASPQDIQRATDNRTKEREAFSICQKKIAEHKLEMKLVSVEYAFDNSKILFFFTANGRVDFRSLVKDLASVFRMRIELRQIGVRDEAKMLGGLGPCGRPICCGTFLDQFQPVSIKMAKEQNLSLNPTKISGVCGRLMCCLKYEQDHYEQTRKKMPRVGKEVVTPDGSGQVTDLNIVKETVFVRMTNGDTSEIREYPLDSVTRPSDRNNTQTGEARLSVHAEAQAESTTTEDPKLDVPREKKREKRTERNQGAERGASDNKGKPKSKDSQLGQPVRRENPNRSRKEVTHDEGKKNTGWAAALEHAIQAIDQNHADEGEKLKIETGLDN